MIPAYVRNLHAGSLKLNQGHEAVVQSGCFAVWDAQYGVGQVVARDAMEWCIATAREHGIAVHALRNSHHIGRVGTYGEMAAAAGLLSVAFVNGAGGPPRVAPYRGRAGRLSTNPMCIAIPATPTNPAIILDFATSRIALGKVRVAANSGKQVVPGALIRADGTATTDPTVIYGGEGDGAVLPFGEHKGYGLALICEILGGAIAGSGVAHKDSPMDRGIVNGWLTFVLDPTRLAAAEAIAAEVDALVEWVKSSPPIDPTAPVLVAGEPERIARAQRERDGIEVDATTWHDITEAARSLGVNVEP